MAPSALEQYCKISNYQVSLGENHAFFSGQKSFDPFTLELYRNLKIDYPKFHKMDRLSKLGFLASEILLQDKSILSNIRPEKIGVILSNRNSSLDTDIRYQTQLESGIPSPAVFVYTLPNIVIGEICIRNNIKGENTFFISDKFDIESQVSYINYLFEKSRLEACIGGWVESVGENHEAFLYFAMKGKGILQLDKNTVEDLYNKKAVTHAGVN